MNMPTFKPTKADPSNLFTVSAFSWLASNTDVRARYARATAENLEQYGIGRWPEPVENQMAEYCHLMVEMEDKAYECWRKAGRRRDSLRFFVEASRDIADVPAWDRSANDTSATL